METCVTLARVHTYRLDGRSISSAERIREIRSACKAVYLNYIFHPRGIVSPGETVGTRNRYLLLLLLLLFLCISVV